MLSLRGLILLAACAAVFCEDDLITACEASDLECLQKSTSKFLKKTAAGVPEYDLRPNDPVIVPELVIHIDEKYDMWDILKNVKVVGLSNQDMTLFNLNKETKTVDLQIKTGDLTVTGDITIEGKKQKKSFSGTFSIKTNAIIKTRYNYDIKTDDKNVAHYEVGPEQISCQSVGDLDVVLNPELLEALQADPDLKEERDHWKANSKANNNKVFCSVIEKAYVNVVHNLRTAAKILPKDAILRGI